VVGQQIEIAALGGGLRGHHAAATERQGPFGGGRGVAGPGGDDGGAHVALLDLGPDLDPGGDRLDGAFGPQPALGVATQADAAAGGFDQHLEGVLQQGGVPPLRPGDRAGDRIREG